MITAFWICKLKCDLYFMLLTEYTISLSDCFIVNYPFPFGWNLSFSSFALLEMLYEQLYAFKLVVHRKH